MTRDLLRADAHLRNSTAMWAALAGNPRITAEYFRVDQPKGTRIILTARPGRPLVESLLADAPTTRAVVIEDVFGSEAPPPEASSTVLVLRMPVMTRAAQPVTVAVPPHSRVVEVRDPDSLADTERVLVEAFPMRAYLPWVRGEAFPASVLSLPGLRVWRADLHGRPAAAGYTYDDGAVVGVYSLATRPEHRSAGLARSLLTTAIASYPGRVCTLVATDAGLRLYRSLGFDVAATTTWYIRAALP